MRVYGHLCRVEHEEAITAFRLREQGLTYRQIGDRMQITEGRARSRTIRGYADVVGLPLKQAEMCLLRKEMDERRAKNQRFPAGRTIT